MQRLPTDLVSTEQQIASLVMEARQTAAAAAAAYLTQPAYTALPGTASDTAQPQPQQPQLPCRPVNRILSARAVAAATGQGGPPPTHVHVVIIASDSNNYVRPTTSFYRNTKTA